MLRGLRTPARIQQFLDDLEYNHAATCYSPRLVLRHWRAHCMEGALLAAAALAELGHPPLLLDLEAVRDDDHVLAIYRVDGHWGAVAKSNYAGLRMREPVYRTTRELALSYFEHYYNLKNEKSLRAYSRPVSLRAFEGLPWRTSEEEVWEVPSHLAVIPHTPLLTARQAKVRRWMDARLAAAGRVGAK